MGKRTKGKAALSSNAAVHAVIVCELQGLKACAVVKQPRGKIAGGAKCHREMPRDINTQCERL